MAGTLIAAKLTKLKVGIIAALGSLFPDVKRATAEST